MNRTELHPLYKTLSRAIRPAALAGMLLVALPSAARAQAIFGDLTGPGGLPDGKVTVGDVIQAQLFALGVVVPTADQIDVANVYPLLSATGGPGGTAEIDFANRNGGNGIPDPSDISVGDVNVIQLAALGLLRMPPRFNVADAQPDLVSLDGIDPSLNPEEVTITGSGFPLENMRVTFTFPEDGDFEVSCDVPVSPVFPVMCTDFSVLSVSATEAVVTAPDATARDVDGNSSTEAYVSITDLGGPTTSTAPDPISFADTEFQLVLVSGDGQAGFPTIPLSQPLVVRATDLTGAALSAGSPVCVNQMRACFVQFEVSLASPHSASLNGSGDSVAVELSNAGFATVSVSPYPAMVNGGRIEIQATLRNFFGDREPGIPPVTFEVIVGSDNQFVLEKQSGDNLTCAAGETCPTVNDPAEALEVSLIDRFGDPVTEPIDYAFTDLGSSADLSTPVLTPALNCTGGPPCSNSLGEAGVFVQAGTFSGGTVTGNHLIGVTASGASRTVKPDAGVVFDLTVQQRLPATIEFVGTSQQERVADRATNTGPFPLDTRVRDQFGTPISGVNVGYAFGATRPASDASTLSVSSDGTDGTGHATSSLTISGTGNGGDLHVDASFPANAVSTQESLTFKFAIGNDALPPLPINLSLVSLTAPVNNTVIPSQSTMAGSFDFSDATNLNALLIRGALGAVEVQSGRSLSNYRVCLFRSGLLIESITLNNGLPSGGSDPDHGRFQKTIGSGTFTPGEFLEIRIADGTCTGQKLSLPRFVRLPGESELGFVTNRTQSEVVLLGIDNTQSPAEVAETDADVTAGTQPIHVTGRRPTAVAFFDTDPAVGGLDRALIVNRDSHDLSIVRIQEEILAAGTDLAVDGLDPTLLFSGSVDFLVDRNAECNPGPDAAATPADDCRVAPGDRIFIDPSGANLRRTIVEIVSSSIVRVAAAVDSALLSSGEFAVRSNYREIDADNDGMTTSAGADPGISRVPLPKPDQVVPFLGADRPIERAEGVAVWQPEVGDNRLRDHGIEARAYVTERTYNGLYVLNMLRDQVTGQWTFEFNDTGIDRDGDMNDDKFLPFPSIRAIAATSASSVSGPSQIVVDGNREVALVVFASGATTDNSTGGVIVVALSPDPEIDPMVASGDDLFFVDPPLRYPTQNASAGLSVPATCSGIFPSFAACEVDTDFDPVSPSVASQQFQNVYFDCDFNGQVDDVDGGLGLSRGASTNACLNPVDSGTGSTQPDTFQLAVPFGVPNQAVTFVTPRPSNLPGDWYSQVLPQLVDELDCRMNCGGATNPDPTLAHYRTDPFLEDWTDDFNPYRIAIPDAGGLLGDLRRDVALVTVRGDDDSGLLTENMRWDPAYLLDFEMRRPGDAEEPPSGAAGATITVIDPATGTSGTIAAASPYPMACAMDFPRLTNPDLCGCTQESNDCDGDMILFEPVNPATCGLYDTGNDPHPRMPDDFVAFPRSEDVIVEISGFPALWGADGKVDTADDLVQPGDILVVDFQEMGNTHVYRYTITGLDTSGAGTAQTRFRIRTDRCDHIPAGVALTRFRVMDTPKIVGFRDLTTLQNASARSVPRGLAFGTHVSPERSLGRMKTDFKDVVDLRSGNDLLAMVSFSNGVIDDPESRTHVGTVDLEACLARDASRNLLRAEGCAEVTVDQPVGSAATAPVLNLRGTGGAGGHLMAASTRFGYLLNPQTAEILPFDYQWNGATEVLSADPFPGLDYLGGPGPRMADPPVSIGELASFSSQNVDETAPVERVLVLNPVHDRVVVIEETGTSGAEVPQLADTNNVAGFRGVPFPMQFQVDSGESRELIDGLVVGNSVDAFFGNILGFITGDGSSGSEFDYFLGLMDYSARTAIDTDIDLSMLQGLETASADGTNGNPMIDFDFDPGRGRLVGLLRRGSSRWEIRAWDLNERAEVDLTEGLQGVQCAPTGTGRFVNFGLPASGNSPTSIASRNGLVLVGFAGNSIALSAVDIDSLPTGAMTADQSCAIDMNNAAVKVPVASFGPDASPIAVVDVVIQGDVAYFLGVRGFDSKIGVLDLTTFWSDRSRLPEDPAISGAVTPTVVGNLGTGVQGLHLSLNGNLLFVTMQENGGDRVKIYDAAPWADQPSGSTAPALRAPRQIGTLDSTVACAGRTRVNGDTLYVVGGRGEPVPCATDTLGGPNLFTVDLGATTLNRTTPPALPVIAPVVGDSDDEWRDIGFLPPSAP